LPFLSEGASRLWLNGEDPVGVPGPVGTVLILPKARNLVMFRVTNVGGTAGFSCKVLEPDQSIRRGEQATKAADGVTVWLAPD